MFPDVMLSDASPAPDHESGAGAELREVVRRLADEDWQACRARRDELRALLGECAPRAATNITFILAGDVCGAVDKFSQPAPAPCADSL